MVPMLNGQMKLPCAKVLFIEHVTIYSTVLLFIAVDCGPLDDPVYGRVTISGTVVYSTATYTCNRGFGLVGVNQRVCQPSGAWSDIPPTCERKSSHPQEQTLI